MTIFDLGGMIGCAFMIAAYFATQQGWLAASDRRFPLLNLIGALLVLISLMKTWNTPSVVVEGFWVLVSLYGLVRPYLRRAGP
jgi:hypothetical protein